MTRLPHHFAVFALLIVAQGCDKPPEIRQYRVAKSRSDLGDIGKVRAEPGVAAAVRDSRMVVAIAARDSATWFFKITGSVDAVAETEKQWKSILTGMMFDPSGKPQWQLPSEWRQGPAQQMRFATLLAEAKNSEAVEMAISSLGPGQDILENVNRWRGQLSLPEIDEKGLNLGELESASGKLLIFDARGATSASGPMAPQQSSRRQPAEPKFVYDVPDGWSEGSQNSITKVRLLHGTDDDAPQITVTQLLAAANEWLPNAQRWADQVGIDTDPAVLKKWSSDVSVDQIDGQKIRLIPTAESKPIGIIAVMVVRDELAWFFKMVGESRFIADNEKDFDEFLKSFRFE